MVADFNISRDCMYAPFGKFLKEQGLAKSLYTRAYIISEQTHTACLNLGGLADSLQLHPVVHLSFKVEQ